MRAPRITAENLANQVDVVSEEIRLNVLNRPYGGFPWIDLPPVLFDTFANAHNGYGDFVDLRAATVADCADFFERYYTPANAVLTVCGGFDSTEAVRADRAALRRRARPPGTGPAVVRRAVAGTRYGERRRSTCWPPHRPLAVGWRLPDPVADLPGYLAHVLLGSVLSVGESSRLQSSLVADRGLATEVWAGPGIMGGPLDARDPDVFVLGAIHTPDVSARRGHRRGYRADRRAHRIRPPARRTAGGAGPVHRLAVPGERLDRCPDPVVRLAGVAARSGRAAQRDPGNRRRSRSGRHPRGRRQLDPDRCAILTVVGEREQPMTPRRDPGRADRRADRPHRTGPASGAGADRADPTAAGRRAAEAVLDSGLSVVAVRKAGTPMVEVRLRIPFGGRTAGAQCPGRVAGRDDPAGHRWSHAGNRSTPSWRWSVVTSTPRSTRSVCWSPGRCCRPGSPVLLDVLADTLTDPAYRRRDVARRAGPTGRAHRDLRRPSRRWWPGCTCSGPGSVTIRRVGTCPTPPWSPTSARPRSAGSTRAVCPAGFHPGTGRRPLPGQDARRRWPRRSPAGRPPGRPSSWQSPPAITGGPVQTFDRPGAVQSQVRLSAAGRSRSDAGYPALQLANLIYGGYFSSRLVENIREDKGYTYSAGSTTEFWPGAAAVTDRFRHQHRVDRGRPAGGQVRARPVGAGRARPRPRSSPPATTRWAPWPPRWPPRPGTPRRCRPWRASDWTASWLRSHPLRLAAVGVDEVAAAAAEILAPSRFVGVVVGDLAAVSPGLAALGDVDLG